PEKKGPSSSEQKLLEGTWEIESWVSGGERLKTTGLFVFGEAEYSRQLEFGRSLVPIDAAGSFRYEVRFRLEKGEVLKRIRETATWPPGSKGQTRVGAYRIDGDKLELSYYLDEKKKDQAPKSLDGSKEAGQELITLKRQKKESKPDPVELTIKLFVDPPKEIGPKSRVDVGGISDSSVKDLEFPSNVEVSSLDRDGKEATLRIEKKDQAMMERAVKWSSLYLTPHSEGK